MRQLSYQQAFDRIRAEYSEMPGMRLTVTQVERLTSIDGAVCKRVLDDLVRTGFLRKSAGESYCLGTDTAIAPLSTRRAKP